VPSPHFHNLLCHFFAAHKTRCYQHLREVTRPTKRTVWEAVAHFGNCEGKQKKKRFHSFATYEFHALAVVESKFQLALASLCRTQIEALVIAGWKLLDSHLRSGRDASDEIPFRLLPANHVFENRT
jgi:hypothetical protein